MKKVVRAAGFLALGMLCATAAFAQAKKGWTTYTTKYYGVSFDLPSDWKTDWDEETKVFSALNKDETLALVFHAFKDETVKTDELFNAAAAEISKDLKIEGEPEEYKDLGGLHAWLGIGHGTVNDVYAVISILAAINPQTDDNLIAYAFADPESADEQDMDTMVKILESFRVVKVVKKEE